MSGRLAVNTSPEALQELFGEGRALPGLHPMPTRFNIAPTAPVLAVIWERRGRRACLMQWNFLPEWVDDPANFTLLPSARAETLMQKPSFRNAIRRRRCLIPVSGFYEWSKLPDGRSQPYYCSARDGGLVALAGLWESWMGPNGEEMDGFALISCRAKGGLRKVTERMPVVIEPEEFDQWLDASSDHFRDARKLVTPRDHPRLVACPVSLKVNNPRNDDESLIVPLVHQGAAGRSGGVSSKTAQAQEETLTDEAPRADKNGQLPLF